MTNAALQALCDRWGATLTDLAESDRPLDPGSFTNKSYCVGDGEILLGVYDDPELRLLSFFHELGHCVSELPPFEEWPYNHFGETMAWQQGLAIATKEGLAIATKEGLVFSDDALAWGREQLGSYFQDDYPERTPLEHLPHALRTAGLELPDA